MSERAALVQSAFLFVVEAGERFEKTPVQLRSAGWLEAQAEELAGLCAADPSDEVTVLGELAGDFAEQARGSISSLREARGWSSAIIAKAQWALRVTATGRLCCAADGDGPPQDFASLAVALADQAYFVAQSGGAEAPWARYIASAHLPQVVEGAIAFLRLHVDDVSPVTAEEAIRLLESVVALERLEVEFL